MNRIIKSFTCVLVLSAAVLSLPVAGKAEIATKKTIVTFTQPVEVGGVILTPGNYIYKSTNHVVQIFDASEKQLLVSTTAQPSYGHDQSSDTQMTIGDGESGAPRVLLTVKLPGATVADEFLSTGK